MSCRFGRRIVVGCVCAALLSAAAPAWAQRGGRGRGEAAASEPGVSKTRYESKEFGFRFGVPPGLDLYTPGMPGRYRSSFTERKILLLVNPRVPEDSIAIKYADGMTEAEVKSYQDILAGTPPQAKLPGFEKVSLASAKFGKDGAEDGIDFVYHATQDGKAMTYRVAVFVHNGRGFTVTCASLTKDFETANREWFESLLKKIEFF